MRNIAIACFTAVVSVVANAQDCMQNFSVKPNALVSAYPWVPGTGTFAAKPISCVALERAREKLFVFAQGRIDAALFKNAQTFEAELNVVTSRLNQEKAVLDKQLASDATLEALRAAFDVVMYDLSKAYTLIECLAPEPVVSKAACYVGLVATAKDTYDIVTGKVGKKEMSERAKTLGEEIAKLESARKSLLEKKAAFTMDASTRRLNETFLGMCQAIQQACL